MRLCFLVTWVETPGNQLYLAKTKQKRNTNDCTNCSIQKISQNWTNPWTNLWTLKRAMNLVKYLLNTIRINSSCDWPQAIAFHSSKNNQSYSFILLFSSCISHPQPATTLSQVTSVYLQIIGKKTHSECDCLSYSNLGGWRARHQRKELL